jgi:muramoyltetrapeptide carboxypeptidase
MRKPSALRAGDRVAIVAPASGCSRDSLDAGADELRRLGFEPTWQEAILERDTFTAGTAAARAADFERAWDDPSVAALIALRGGYGSVHLLPRLAGRDLAQRPKLFVGYSDNTSIMTWLTCHAGVTALHGPMLDGRLSRGASGYDESSFLALVQGGAGLRLMPDGLQVVRSGEASGLMFGGTLTQLTASLGTPYAFAPPAGCVLFLEDVNERPYRLDRMLTQLALAGVLSRARALVFGEMRGCDEPDGRATALGVAQSVAAQFDGPVLYGFPSGHTSGPCWTVPFGVTCRVTTAPRPGVIVEESPVA